MMTRAIVKEITEDSSREKWDYMIKEIHSGKLTEVSESVYYYFLEVLPPIRMFDYGFYFREGLGDILRFTQQGNKFYCKKLSDAEINKRNSERWNND